MDPKSLIHRKAGSKAASSSSHRGLQGAVCSWVGGMRESQVKRGWEEERKESQGWDILVGVEDEVPTLWHAAGEVAHDGLRLHMQAAEHFVKSPAAKEAGDICGAQALCANAAGARVAPPVMSCSTKTRAKFPPKGSFAALAQCSLCVEGPSAGGGGGTPPGSGSGGGGGGPGGAGGAGTTGGAGGPGMAGGVTPLAGGTAAIFTLCEGEQIAVTKSGAIMAGSATGGNLKNCLAVFLTISES